MVGPVALVGAGEFLPQMAEVDRELLAASGRDRPRVAIVPTASAPDGEDTFRRWADLGCEHFARLGAEVEPVLVRDVAGGSDPAALQALGEADLVYLSGGHPGFLLRVLRGSGLGPALVAAHGRGAVVAGCSAGAMAIVGRLVGLRRARGVPVPLPFPLGWADALGLVPGVAVLPHYDRWPEAVAAAVALQAPRGGVVLGIDEDTAAIGRDGLWTVRGRGRVTAWRGRHRLRHRRGEVFRLPEIPAAAGTDRGA